MKKLLLFISLMILSACDAPQTRSNRPGDYSPNSTFDSTGSGSGVVVGQADDRGGVPLVDKSEESSENEESTNSTDNTPTVPDNIKHCKWSFDGSNGYQYTSTLLGNFTVCKSSTTETDIYVQASTAITSERLCLFPATSNNSKTVFIGEATCQFLPDPKKAYKFKLYKNRTNFQSYPITGVMMVFHKVYNFPYPYSRAMSAVEAYIDCSLQQDLYGDSRYCQAFKSVGQYVFKSF